MHGLILSVIVGVCCTTCPIWGGLQPDEMAIQVIPPQDQIEMSSEVTGQVMAAESNVVGDGELLVSQSIAHITGEKELASEPFKSTIKAPVSKKDAEPMKTSTVREQVSESMAIDTIDLEQPEGNWLTKRVWWERAKDKYKECRDVFESIFALRMTFLEKRSDIEKTVLDPFYREIGLEQGELRELLSALIEKIEEERQETGFLDEKERAFLQKITTAQKDLEQLKLDIDMINNIDMAVDKAINTLSGKINEAHRFEQSAWEEFDAIARELSDKRAYERYYVIDGIHKNLKELQKYIAQEFTNYFSSLVQAAQEKTERAKAEVKGLKDQDIALTELVKQLVTEELTEEEKESKRVAQQVADEAKKAAEAAQASLFCTIWKAFVGALKGLWNLLFGWWLYRI